MALVMASCYIFDLTNEMNIAVQLSIFCEPLLNGIIDHDFRNVFNHSKAIANANLSPSRVLMYLAATSEPRSVRCRRPEVSMTSDCSSLTSGTTTVLTLHTSSASTAGRSMSKIAPSCQSPSFSATTARRSAEQNSGSFIVSLSACPGQQPSHDSQSLRFLAHIATEAMTAEDNAAIRN